MASLANDPNGRKRITFSDPIDGRQRAVRLGKMSKKKAEGVLLHVESLILARTIGQAPAQETAQWLAGVVEPLFSRLVRADLAKPRQAPATHTLAEVVDAFTDRRTDVKPQTKAVWHQARKHLITFFTADRDITTITPADCDDFRRHVRTEYSEAYTAKMVMVCKAIFRDAARRRLVLASPFIDVRNGSQRNAERRRFIDRETIARVMDATTDPEWKLIIALARFGGLRVPSELANLKWSDVLWAEKRLIITSPKTSHHEGHGQRVCPLFPEIETHLQAVFDATEPGESIYVLPRHRGSAMNLRTQFQRIIARSGVAPWPKLFQNLRASRATELADQLPSHVAAAFLGHAEKIADDHYRHVTDDHFALALSSGDEKASRKASRQPSETARNPSKPQMAGIQNPLNLPSISTHCGKTEYLVVGDEGFEPPTLSV